MRLPSNQIQLLRSILTEARDSNEWKNYSDDVERLLNAIPVDATVVAQPPAVTDSGGLSTTFSLLDMGVLTIDDESIISLPDGKSIRVYINADLARLNDPQYAAEPTVSFELIDPGNLIQPQDMLVVEIHSNFALPTVAAALPLELNDYHQSKSSLPINPSVELNICLNELANDIDHHSKGLLEQRIDFLRDHIVRQAICDVEVLSWLRGEGLNDYRMVERLKALA